MFKNNLKLNIFTFLIKETSFLLVLKTYLNGKWMKLIYGRSRD